MLPFEFIVVGIPVSHQTKNKKRLQSWKGEVRLAASQQWPNGEPPLDCEVTFEVTCFYDTDPPDVDNIIKPIQDALIGIVYVDDNQVARTSSRKSRIDGAFKIFGVPVDLAIALATGKDFLRVRVLPGPIHEDLS